MSEMGEDCGRQVPPGLVLETALLWAHAARHGLTTAHGYGDPYTERHGPGGPAYMEAGPPYAAPGPAPWYGPYPSNLSQPRAVPEPRRGVARLLRR